MPLPLASPRLAGRGSFQAGGNVKPSVTDRMIHVLAVKLLRQRLDNAVWHKRLNVAT